MTKALVVCLVACQALVAATSAAGAPLNRPDDPVVMTGATVPALQGIPPSQLVAFRWSSGWDQVPVQVDERRLIDINEAYDPDINSGGPGYTCSGNSQCFGQPPNGVEYVNYTDPNTWVGPDSDATLDANDEIALMAKDTGARRVGLAEPSGVTGQGVEVKVTDPLDSGEGYVYLFRHDGSLDPSAGQQYVDYDFNLTSGNYKTTYKRNGGSGASTGNPETSAVTTPSYKRGFTDRWNDNELRITRGGATGTDILDRHDDQFERLDLTCVRTQLTFRVGEGAFIANKSGPVRAIRDFIGANSGPQVQRQHVFYEGKEDINTHLRVHAIPGVIDFFDYTPAAMGMQNSNIFNPTPVTVDGTPDVWNPGAGVSGMSGWEQIDGLQGGLSTVHEYVTNNPDPSYSTAYRDEASPPTTCGGDSSLYGATGVQAGGALNSTDEANGGTTRLFYRRTIYYEAPGLADGAARLEEDENPLTLTVRDLPSGYPRPQAASPTRVALVPAFEPCTSANGTHGEPLAAASCSPPNPTSDFLTLGAPDVNGQPARSTGLVRATVVGETPLDHGNGDQADVQVTTSLTDVRNAGSLSDYTGELRVALTHRITDRYNGSALDDPATVSDTGLAFSVPCTATVGPGGSACSVATTADAILPGLVREGQRAIWELGRVQVYDGGGDGDGDTAGDNTLFAVQGVFIP